MPSHRKRISGFTLIELLVVVAIIAVLISILLPSLAGARAQSRQVLCNTNLRSMGQAAYIYAHEYRDTLVRGEFRTQDQSATLLYASCLLRGLGWDGKVAGLWRERQQWFFREAARKVKPFQCPTFPLPEQDLDYVVNSSPNPYSRTNYDYDQGLLQPPGDDDGPEGAGVDAIRMFKITDFPRVSPARVTYITEAHRKHAVAAFDLFDVFIAGHLPFSSTPRIANDKRHPGGLNVLFFDGHAETMAHRKFDVGWPAAISQRLRYMTFVPPEFEN